MIPQEVIDVTQGSYIAYLGSRDDNFTPAVRVAWGIGFKPAEDMVTGFVVDANYDQMLKNFRQNGRIALTYSDNFTHVAYQLKGQFLQARPLTEAEAIRQQQYVRTLIDVLLQMGFPEERVNAVVCLADLAIDIRVEKIFNQTPGPGAGKEITF